MTNQSFCQIEDIFFGALAASAHCHILISDPGVIVQYQNRRWKIQNLPESQPLHLLRRGEQETFGSQYYFILQ